MRPRLIVTIVAAAIVIGIVAIATARLVGNNRAKNETVGVSVSVVACVETMCFTLPVPDVAITVAGAGRQLAHGVTDETGKLTLTLPHDYSGTVTVTVASEILKDGGLSQDQSVSGGESISLNIAVPIAAQARPGA